MWTIDRWTASQGAGFTSLGSSAEVWAAMPPYFNLRSFAAAPAALRSPCVPAVAAPTCKTQGTHMQLQRAVARVPASEAADCPRSTSSFHTGRARASGLTHASAGAAAEAEAAPGDVTGLGTPLHNSRFGTPTRSSSKNNSSRRSSSSSSCCSITVGPPSMSTLSRPTSVAAEGAPTRRRHRASHGGVRCCGSAESHLDGPAHKPCSRNAVWHSTAFRVRTADPRDAAALAALDAASAADGSSGWSQGIYEAELQPGGPNLVVLCELLLAPVPHEEAATAAKYTGAQEVAAGLAKASEAPVNGAAAGPSPGSCRVVALAAGCWVAGEASLTNLAVAAELRGTGLGRRMVAELLTRLGAERYPTFLEVRKDNAAAQALYGKLGFAVAGLRKRYNADGSDSLVMVRQPAPLPPPETTPSP